MATTSEGQQKDQWQTEHGNSRSCPRTGSRVAETYGMRAGIETDGQGEIIGGDADNSKVPHGGHACAAKNLRVLSLRHDE